jgi:hypothetical protein
MVTEHSGIQVNMVQEVALCESVANTTGLVLLKLVFVQIEN